MTLEINTPNGPAVQSPHGEVLLSDLFWLDTIENCIIWKARPIGWFSREQSWKTWNSRFAGKKVTAIGSTGYYYACVFYKRMAVHRIIYAMHFGAWPKNGVDHIDGNRFNNNPENMRDATQAENMKNVSASKRNKSGVSGVWWREKIKRWSVSIGRGRHIGTFRTFEDAVIARKKAETQLGYHQNHGRKFFAVTEPN